MRGKRRRRAVVVLCSGGLDSCVLVAEYLRRGWSVLPIYIESGLVWEHEERKGLARFLRAVGSPRLRPLVVSNLPLQDIYQTHWSVTGRGVPGAESPDQAVYLPGRNLILLSKAFVLAALHRIEVVALAFLKGNPFPDSQKDFLRSYTKAASLALGRSLKVETPFAALTKADVIRRGRDLPLGLTVSCLRPGGMVHCGRCNKCRERQKGFRQAGVVDSTRYANSRGH